MQCLLNLLMSHPSHITINYGKFNREKQAPRKEMHAFSLSSLCHSKNAILEIAYIVEKLLIFYLMICKLKCHHRNKFDMEGGIMPQVPVLNSY